MKQKESKNIVYAWTDDGPVWPHSVVLSKPQTDRCTGLSIQNLVKMPSQNVTNLAVFTRKLPYVKRLFRAVWFPSTLRNFNITSFPIWVQMDIGFVNILPTASVNLSSRCSILCKFLKYICLLERCQISLIKIVISMVYDTEHKQAKSIHLFNAEKCLSSLKRRCTVWPSFK